MKQFNNFNDAFKWVDSKVEQASVDALPIIAEQVYKDSDKYTFRDTGAMFDTGALNSDFKRGFVVERAPQVRMLYYGDFKAGAGNGQAIPMWFERTKKENGKKYEKMYITIFNQQKGR